MIKKITTLILIWLWLLNFSVAYECGYTAWTSVSVWNWVRSVWTLFNSPVDINFSNTVLQNWVLYSLNNTSNVSRAIFTYNSTNFFWIDNNWLPYLYFNWNYWDKHYQWTFNKYLMCDSLSSSSTQATNCSPFDISSSSSEFILSFLNSVSPLDYWGYFYEDISSYRHFYFCVSSSSYWNSMCFVFFDKTPWFAWTNCWLHDSLNLDVWFNSIPDNLIYWWSSWWWDWWTVINTWSNAWNNWNFVNVPCTNWNIKRFYEESGYSPNLCYWGDYFWDLWTEEYSTEFLIPWVWYNIFEIYNHLTGAIWTWNSYSTWNSLDVRFHYWRSQYSWRTNQYVSTNNPFAWYPRVVFWLFNYVTRYGATYQDKYILDYCNLLINSDLSSMYTWSNSSVFHCSNWIVDWSDWWNWWLWDNSSFWSSSWSWTFLGVWTWSLWSGDVYSFSTFVTNFFDIVSNVFNGLSWFETRVWFLPRYIVATLLFLVLFRFLSH